MSIMKRNANLFTSFPGTFDDLLTRDLFNWNTSNFSSTGTTIPAVNIRETADTYEVQVAAPGMTRDDFKVELDGNVLTISSEKKNERQGSQEERYNMKEFSYQSFQRSFTLSRDVVDAEKIAARYDNGVLYLMIPKREEVKQKPARLISIS